MHTTRYVDLVDEFLTCYSIVMEERGLASTGLQSGSVAQVCLQQDIRPLVEITPPRQLISLLGRSFTIDDNNLFE